MHTRRQARGYKFETDLVKAFNQGNWKARRLGGSSSGLPDVGIMNDTQSILYAVEAKSTVYNFCTVPVKQIQRCLNYLNLYSLYQNKYVILAFKFASKRSKRSTNSKVKILREKPTYFFFIIKGFKDKKLERVQAFNCNSKGKVTFIVDNPQEGEQFDDYAIIDHVTTITDLKHYGWDSQQSNFDHLFTV